MKRLTAILCAALAAALACSKSSTAPDPDVIDGAEMAAVRTSLDSALKDDSNYAILRTIVFGLLDRASHITDAAGETRIAGFQLDIDATKGTQPFVAQLSGVLAWRGYSPTWTPMTSAGETEPRRNCIKWAMAPYPACTRR